MKTFTKIFLAITFGAIYITGYGANLQPRVNHDGVYIPKTPVAPQQEQLAWGGKAGNALVSSFKSAFNWAALTNSVTKTIATPKKYRYNFTANATPNSTLGVSLYNAAITWDDGKLKPSITAFPNPSKGKFTISLAQSSNAKYKITVSNTIGNVVKIIAVPDSLRNPEINFDLSESPAGIYFYSLYVNDKMVETKRLILQQ